MLRGLSAVSLNLDLSSPINSAYLDLEGNAAKNSGNLNPFSHYKNRTKQCQTHTTFQVQR